jgi:hypothetical protein
VAPAGGPKCLVITLLIDWIPGTGTVIVVTGQPQGDPFREPEFFNALLGTWPGHAPADCTLKTALLGKPAWARRPAGAAPSLLTHPAPHRSAQQRRAVAHHHRHVTR